MNANYNFSIATQYLITGDRQEIRRALHIFGYKDFRNYVLLFHPDLKTEIEWLKIEAHCNCGNLIKIWTDFGKPGKCGNCLFKEAMNRIEYA